MLHTTRMALIVVAALWTGTACSAGVPAATPATSPTTVGSAPAPTGAYAPAIDPAAFGTTVDNPFFPLRPGTPWDYRSATKDGLETTVVTVTRTARMIVGVRCVEVRDTVRLDGALLEDTRDWYAQDRAGAVWYFGEDTKEYENGKVSSTEGSWRAGVGGALPGVMMPAVPAVGDHYRQEYLRGHAEDQAAVVSLAEHARVPAGTYDRAVMTEETTPLEPNVLEHKYYARGVGMVLTVDVSAGGERDELIRYTG